MGVHAVGLPLLANEGGEGGVVVGDVGLAAVGADASVCERVLEGRVLSQPTMIIGPKGSMAWSMYLLTALQLFGKACPPHIRGQLPVWPRHQDCRRSRGTELGSTVSGPEVE